VGGWDSVQTLALDATGHPMGAWGAAVPMQFATKANGRCAYLGDTDLYVFGGDVTMTATSVGGWSGSTLGTFAAAPNIMQGPLRYNTALVGLGSWVAIAGGTDQAAGTPVDTVWLAARDGANFGDTGRHLLHARRGASGVALGNYFYVIGGDAGGSLAGIEAAPLQ
jgi:hypothetical protein